MGKLKDHLNKVILPSWNFSGRLETERDEQMNAVVGLSAESGEVLDVCKKMWFHDYKPFKEHRKKLVLELGDVLYYFLITLSIFGISLKEVIEGNREKLESRHPELGKVKERFSGDFIK